MARHLGEHIPGKPTVVVQNMPAAGGLGAANHTYNVAAKDGTVITLFQNTVPLEPFFENKQAQFDAAKFGWLGTPTTEVALYMFWHTSKIKTVKDAQTHEYVAGAAGAASTPAFYGRVFNQLFNFKARFIVGYPGQNEILHAMEGGEVEAMASPFWSSLKTSRPTWYKEGKIRFLFQYGGADRIRNSRACRSGSICCRPRPTRRCWWWQRRRSGSAGRSARRPASPPTGSPRCAPR